MGRRKQHCPKKTNDNNDDDPNQDQMEDNQGGGKTSPNDESLVKGTTYSDVTKLIQLQRAHRLALQAHFEEQQIRSKISPHTESPLDLSASLRPTLGSSLHKQQILSPSLSPHSRSPLSPPAAPSPFSNFTDPKKIYANLSTSDLLLRFPPAPNIFPPPINPFLPRPTDTRSPRFDESSQHYAMAALHRMSELARLNRSDEKITPRWPHIATTGQPWFQRPPPLTNNDASKDIFRCVWCQERYENLADLTQHMKDAKHTSSSSPTLASISNSPKGISALSEMNSTSKKQNTNSKSSLKNSSNNSSNDSSVSMPRKLVRGQDVWLGKGQEQTRQILKCMWCGESFKSLAELTVHMQETQHYTKVISQEQISSWKSSKSNDLSNKTSGGGDSPKSATSADLTNSSVLRCQVCSKSYTTLRELSDHMVKDNHLRVEDESSGLFYKKKSSLSSASSLVSATSMTNCREKRKKSLPVRKLLELERESHEMANKRLKIDSEFLNTTSDGKKSSSEASPKSSSAGSILGSLEKMVESSFATKGESTKTDGELLGIEESETSNSPESFEDKMQMLLKKELDQSDSESSPLLKQRTRELANFLQTNSNSSFGSQLLFGDLAAGLSFGSKKILSKANTNNNNCNINPLDSLRQMCPLNSTTKESSHQSNSSSCSSPENSNKLDSMMEQKVVDSIKRNKSLSSDNEDEEKHLLDDDDDEMVNKFNHENIDEKKMIPLTSNIKTKEQTKVYSQQQPHKTGRENSCSPEVSPQRRRQRRRLNEKDSMGRENDFNDNDDNEKHLKKTLQTSNEKYLKPNLNNNPNPSVENQQQQQQSSNTEAAKSKFFKYTELARQLSSR